MGRQGVSAGADGREHSYRRTHPDDRRLLRRGDDRAAVPQSVDTRQRHRSAAARDWTRARPEAGPAVHRAPAGARRGARHPGAADDQCRAAGRDRRIDCRRTDSGKRRECIRKHRARTSRDLRAVRDCAGDGHQPRRGGHDGTDLVEDLENRPLVGLRAVPVQPGIGFAQVPLCGRHRRDEAVERDVEGRLRPVRLGGAQPPHARQRRSARHVRSGCALARARAEIGSRLPAAFQRRAHRQPRALSRGREPLHRGPSTPARAHRRAGRCGHPQLNRLRADAGRFAHRPADRTAEPPIDVRAPVARARARRAAQDRSRADRDGRRRLQGDQRHVRPQRRRPRAPPGRDRASGRAAPLRPVRALRRR